MPDGFHRIRHIGFLANGHRATKLALCRTLLAAPAPDPPTSQSYRDRIRQLTGHELDVCPDCGDAMLERGPLPRAVHSLTRHSGVTAHDRRRNWPINRTSGEADVYIGAVQRTPMMDRLLSALLVRRAERVMVLKAEFRMSEDQALRAWQPAARRTSG